MKIICEKLGAILYAMAHGRDDAEVLARAQRCAAHLGLDTIDHVPQCYPTYRGIGRRECWMIFEWPDGREGWCPFGRHTAIEYWVRYGTVLPGDRSDAIELGLIQPEDYPPIFGGGNGTLGKGASYNY
jgi:hypothetical protein